GRPDHHLQGPPLTPPAEAAATAHQPLGARIYGVRLLYSPQTRHRVGLMVGGLATAAYIFRAVQQLVLLRNESLQWDFRQFYNAASALNRGIDPYRAFLDSCPRDHWCKGGYIFPPLLAEMLRPLATLPFYSAARLWLLLTHLALVATILVVRRLLRGRVSAAGQGLLLAASLLFLPLYQSLYFLQVGVLLVLLLALAASALASSEDTAAGTWIAVAAMLRVTPVLLLPVLLRRRRDLTRPWGMVAAAITALVVVALLAVLTPYTIEYFTRVLPRINGGTAGLDNQSLAAVGWRAGLLLGGETPFRVLALLVALAMALLTWYTVRGQDSRAGRELAFAGFLALLPIISSITWQHHLVTELLVICLLAPHLRHRTPAMRLVLASYPLLWVDRHITDPLTVLIVGPHQPSGLLALPFLVTTGLNLVGMVLVWVAAILVLRQHRAGWGQGAATR
ncbi:MAG: glycosyltransferase 87 family protein, partial [Candidatus Dormibacteria bacterium]